MVRSYKVVLVGPGGVGKSCLAIQYISQKFVDDYDPTLEDSYRKQTAVDGKECVLDIFDTAGQEAFSAVRDQYMRSGEGFLCVFAITSKSSYDEAQKLYDHIIEIKDVDSIPFVLVGNKSDLEDARQVPTKSASDYAEGLNCPYIETSAKNRENVYEAFEAVVHEMMVREPADDDGDIGGDEAQKLYDHIIEIKDVDSIPFVLVGNKSDLEDARQVPTKSASDYAEGLNCPYIETSAKNRENVYEAFEAVVHEMMVREPADDDGDIGGAGGGGGASDSKKGDKKRRGCLLM
eukprot:TRINITY_DN176_c0_g1_i4.p1 TRINITY_DN176_c0_g1~~TRINITY_DN176_c0_g1_i4.p1  ORF type:complete len:302 (-),score=88.95 TRINITY_DN176_c0_g1_i4:295-1167(-)